MKLINENLTRQLDILPVKHLGQQITVIGAGAVGGWTVLSLTKMGFGNIRVFDFDEVSIENMNCQFYPFDAIGKNKAIALKEQVKKYSNFEIEAIPERYDESKLSPGIIICAVDSMKVRKKIWDIHCGKSPNTRYFIDPRMGAETALLYVMNPMSMEDRKSYKKTLYTDTEAVQERCTAKATIYTANLLAGLVCKAVKDIVVGKPYTRVVNWDIGENQAMLFRSDGKVSK